MDSFEAASTAVPASEAPVSAPTSEAPLATPGPAATPEQLVELKWRGKTERIPLAKAIELAQQGYDYTQKTQSLADKERQYQAQIAQYEQAVQQVREFLLDRERVRQYYEELSKNAGPEPDPDQPLTREQAQQLLQRERQQWGMQTQQQLERMRQQWEINQLASTYEGDLAATIRGVQEKHPELRAVPRLLETLKAEAAERQPKSIEEAKAFIVELAEQHANELRSHFAKQGVVGTSATPMPTAALARGIEPPGGSGPMPPAAPNINMKDPRWRDVIMNDILQMSQGGSGR